MKDEIGLFENSMPRADRLSRVGDPALRAQATNAAREGVVLLKNAKNVLPLAPGRVKRLLVVGPSAEPRANLSGGWTLAWQGRPEEAYPKDVPTLVDALRREYPQAIGKTMPYRDAAGKAQLTNISAAARRAGAVVLALGERPYTEGMGNTSDLTLPDDQQALTRPALTTAASTRAVRNDVAAFEPAYPNPTSGRAQLPFNLTKAATVSLAVYDHLGRRVAEVLRSEPRRRAQRRAERRRAGSRPLHLPPHR